MDFGAALLKIIISFVSTNLDDLVVLTILFAQAATPKDRRKIFFGQFLAIMSLLTVSMLLARLVGAFKLTHLNLLGLIPLLIGCWYLFNDWRIKDRPKHKNVQHHVDKISIMSVFLLTIANGSDNIGLYLPLIVQFNIVELIAMYLIFALAVILWCVLGMKIVKIPPVEKFLQRENDVLVPLVFILLGLSIIFF